MPPDRTQARKSLRALLAAGCLVVLALVAMPALAQPVEESAVVRIYGPFAPLVLQTFDILKQLAILTLVTLPFQVLFPAMQRTPKVRSYEYWLDVLYGFQTIWLTGLGFMTAVSWVGAAVYGTSGGMWFPALGQLPVLAQVLVAIWAFDFIVYWRHRFEHTFAPLWSFHAVHHTAESVDVLTTFRLHPFEVALGAILNAAVFRLGMDPAATAFGFALYLYYNYFIHTNVRIRFPWPLKYVLVSPFMHHWHHAKDDAAMGKNVGVVFAWNDWLFGTAYHPDHWPKETGLAAPPAERVGQSYLRHVVYPVQFAVARWAAWRAARAV